MDIYLSRQLDQRQNARLQDGGNMRVIANGIKRFVLVFRVMPRILIFQDKILYNS